VTPLVISLTTIPPRFAQLPRVIAGLRAQTACPARILLTIPRQYRRFPGSYALPKLEGVEVLRPERDPGPIGKVSEAVHFLRGRPCHLLYCDDDWLYGPGWAQGFLDTARTHPGAVIATSTFNVRRLGLTGGDGARIAQGFGGVIIDPNWLGTSALTPPASAWAVDDIWLSAQYARTGRTIIEASHLRRQVQPLADPDRLQDAVVKGENRADANRKMAHHLAAEYGIWGR